MAQVSDRQVIQKRIKRADTKPMRPPVLADNEKSEPADRMSRRSFMLTALLSGASGAAALSLTPTEALALVGRPSLVVDRFRHPTDPDDTLSFRRALAQAARAGVSRVVGTPNRVYRVAPITTTVVRNPSGGTTRHPVCIRIPNGVTLDLDGSVIVLDGEGESVVVCNQAVDGRGRDRQVGLVNAVIDGGGIQFSSASLVHLAYIDELTLENVWIRNGSYQGAWIYNCSRSSFERLQASDFVGQPWTIGSPLGAGNHVYESSFGRMSATRIRAQNATYQPGNSFDLVLTRCHVQSLSATDCDAGIKIQFPSSDVTIDRAEVFSCGDASGNSGLKIQGDPLNGPVVNVTVGAVVAVDQTGPGLYLDSTAGCQVVTYQGLRNNLNGDASDVWIGGVCDAVGELRSEASGGNGVLVREYASSYRLNKVTILNPGQSDCSVNRAAVAVYGGRGEFGTVTCIDDQANPTMSHGVDVCEPSAVGNISLLGFASTGESVAFSTVSRGFPKPKVTESAWDSLR